MVIVYSVSVWLGCWDSIIYLKILYFNFYLLKSSIPVIFRVFSIYSYLISLMFDIITLNFLFMFENN